MGIAIVDIDRLWAEKAERLSGMVRRIARGDDDMHQVGLLGLREGLLRDPNANDSYLLQAARYAMTNHRNRGRSVDNGSKHATTRKLSDGTVRTYRKAMVPVYVDRLNAGSGLELPGHSHAPDIRALDRICAGVFYASLDREEAEVIDACIQTLGGRSHDVRAMRELGMDPGSDRDEFFRIKRTAYHKFIRIFGTDEDIERLDERLDGGDFRQ